MRRLHGAAWPRFLRDDAVNTLWPRLYAEFPQFQLALHGPGGRVVAIGNTVPFAWNGTRRVLPDRGQTAADRAVGADAGMLTRSSRGRELRPRSDPRADEEDG